MSSGRWRSSGLPCPPCPPEKPGGRECRRHSRRPAMPPARRCATPAPCPVRVRTARIRARIMDAIWVPMTTRCRLMPVGHNAAQRSDQKHGELAGESDRAQQQRGPGQAIDQPCLGHPLHPGADQRNELSAEEKLEVAMAQGTQGCGQSDSCCHGAVQGLVFGICRDWWIAQSWIFHSC